MKCPTRAWHVENTQRYGYWGLLQAEAGVQERTSAQSKEAEPSQLSTMKQAGQ